METTVPSLLDALMTVAIMVFARVSSAKQKHALVMMATIVKTVPSSSMGVARTIAL
jgi:predicted site-specific integrase-resolvase